MLSSEWGLSPHPVENAPSPNYLGGSGHQKSKCVWGGWSAARRDAKYVPYDMTIRADSSMCWKCHLVGKKWQAALLQKYALHASAQCATKGLCPSDATVVHHAELKLAEPQNVPTGRRRWLCDVVGPVWASTSPPHPKALPLHVAPSNPKASPTHLLLFTIHQEPQ